MTGTQLFVSYSHRDEKWLHRLQVHLAPLIRHQAVAMWSDAMIAAGAEWRSDIAQAIERANFALLLVSPEFLASEFVAANELPRLLERSRRGRLHVTWLAVSHSSYALTKISQYQALNDPNRPLSSLRRSDVDKTLVSVCEQIASLCDTSADQGAQMRSAVESVDSSGAEEELWRAVEQYRTNAAYERVVERVAVDARLKQLQPPIRVDRLLSILDEAPNDPEVQMAVAVLLGGSTGSENEQQVVDMLARLLRSSFQRPRYRAAESIERYVTTRNPSDMNGTRLRMALEAAIQSEESVVVRDCLELALSKLR